MTATPHATYNGLSERVPLIFILLAASCCLACPNPPPQPPLGDGPAGVTCVSVDSNADLLDRESSPTLPRSGMHTGRAGVSVALECLRRSVSQRPLQYTRKTHEHGVRTYGKLQVGLTKFATGNLILGFLHVRRESGIMVHSISLLLLPKQLGISGTQIPVARDRDVHTSGV